MPVCQLAKSLQHLLLDERGSIGIIAAFTLPVVVGGLGLMAETGYWYMEQRKLQHAADVAAHAGAIRLMQGDDKAAAEAAALHIAQMTGYQPGTLTFNTPYGGDAAKVEVILSETKPRLLSAIFNSTSTTLTGRAVGIYKWADGHSQACVLSLSPTAQNAIKILGNSAVNAPNCDLVTNSNNPNAVNVDNIKVNCVYAVGDGDASQTTAACGNNDVKGQQTAFRDPYADRDLPPMDSCLVSGNQTYPKNPKTVENYTHPSGCQYSVFTGNVTFQKTVNLAAGYYVFKKGFTVDPSNAPPTIINGTGVTLIFIGEKDNDLSTSGNGIWNISAPTSGPTAGIALWIPKESPIVTANFNASSSSLYTGAIYAPDTKITINGGSSNTSLSGGGCTQIIGLEVTITGGGTFSATEAGCAGTGTEPVKTKEYAALIE
jgi:hypothetical protein